jgi:hypothetical protein
MLPDDRGRYDPCGRESAPRSRKPWSGSSPVALTPCARSLDHAAPENKHRFGERRSRATVAAPRTWRRFPNLLYRRFPNRQAVRFPRALETHWRRRLGGLRHSRLGSRLGSLRYDEGGRRGFLRVAQVSKPAVSPISSRSRDALAPQARRPATQQTWKSAIRRGRPSWLLARGAGFQTCCIADFLIGRPSDFLTLSRRTRAAGSEACDTADLELCDTTRMSALVTCHSSLVTNPADLDLACAIH